MWLSTQEDFILHKAANMLHGLIGDFWVKPIFDCPYCMSSVHGGFVYLFSLVIGLHELPVLGVVLFIPVVCGFQVLIFDR